MNPTVLVCDDQDVVRSLVSAILEQQGLVVAQAVDGDQALEKARELRPDLVLLDVHMPGRSGCDVLAELRADDDLAATPVILLTGALPPGGNTSSPASSADLYLAKPFAMGELTAAVERLLGRE